MSTSTPGDESGWIIAPGVTHDAPEVWDTLVLGGVSWPGLAKVTVSRANKWDEKKAKGENSAEREYTGTEPANVKIVVRIWDVYQYQELLSECLPIVEPDEGNTRKDPLDISHAVTIARKVGQVTIDSVSGPDDNGDQTWSFSVDATEYRAPTPIKQGAPKKGGGSAKAQTPCQQYAQEYEYWRSNYVAKSQAADQLRVQANESALYDGPGSAEFASLSAQYNEMAAEAIYAQAKMAEATARMAAEGCPTQPSAGASQP